VMVVAMTFLSAVGGHPDTIAAANCTSSAIQAAINSASD